MQRDSQAERFNQRDSNEETQSETPKSRLPKTAAISDSLTNAAECEQSHWRA